MMKYSPYKYSVIVVASLTATACIQTISFTADKTSAPANTPVQLNWQLTASNSDLPVEIEITESSKNTASKTVYDGESSDLEISQSTSVTLPNLPAGSEVTYILLAYPKSISEKVKACKTTPSTNTCKNYIKQVTTTTTTIKIEKSLSQSYVKPFTKNHYFPIFSDVNGNSLVSDSLESATFFENREDLPSLQKAKTYFFYLNANGDQIAKTALRYLSSELSTYSNNIILIFGVRPLRIEPHHRLI